MPPDAWRSREYRVPTNPEGSGDVVVIESGVPGGTMIRLKPFCAVCGGVPLSVARIVKLNEPSALGVPLSVPLDERFSPAGKEPNATDHV